MLIYPTIVITCSYIANAKVNFLFSSRSCHTCRSTKRHVHCFACHGSKGNMTFVDFSTIKLKVRRAKFTCFKSVNFAINKVFCLVHCSLFFVFSLKFEIYQSTYLLSTNQYVLWSLGRLCFTNNGSPESRDNNCHILQLASGSVQISVDYHIMHAW